MFSTKTFWTRKNFLGSHAPALPMQFCFWAWDGKILEIRIRSGINKIPGEIQFHFFSIFFPKFFRNFLVSSKFRNQFYSIGEYLIFARIHYRATPTLLYGDLGSRRGHHWHQESRGCPLGEPWWSHFILVFVLLQMLINIFNTWLKVILIINVKSFTKKLKDMAC